eukprot:TRINITY_DN444_c4_g1_i1.p1 TRINITY_DN444_c4_g1~~TRINITY_DN444_c4_g1_i1.p1  ORF type:complete len:435 (-),score=156.63 TRINITY_DN444_c4_g1_i1:1526-2773(-)
MSESPAPPMPQRADASLPASSPPQSELPMPPARISVGSDRLELESPPPLRAAEASSQTEPLSPPPPPPQSATEAAATSTQAATPQPSRRGRKRKQYVVSDHGAVEISAAQFRAALNDTSDLMRESTLRAPQRRRVAPSSSLAAAAHDASRFEQLISRPTLQLAPQLMQLFEANFRAHELIVASPISDAELGVSDARGDVQAQQEAEMEQQTAAREQQQQQQQQEEQEAIGATEKEVSADPTLMQLEGMDVMAARVEDEESAAVAAAAVARDTLSPVQAARASEEMEELRAVSMGRESVAVSMAASAAGEEVEDELTLRSVAETAAQLQDEEQVSESSVSARTKRMQLLIAAHLHDGEFDFSGALSSQDSRRTAARCFYELLNLSNKKAISLRQQEAYGTIWARPIQPTFDALLQT